MRAHRENPRASARVAPPAIPGAQAAQIAAAKLLEAQRAIGGRASVKDVFAWRTPSGWNFAFTGKPSSLASAFRLGFTKTGDTLATTFPYNRNGWRLSEGVAAEAADKVFGERGGHGGHWGDAAVFPHDILGGFERYAESVVDTSGEPVGDCNVTLIPEPGYPYVYGAEGMPYYSAREGRWFTSSRPPWVTLGWRRDENGNDVQAPVADWCRISPHVGDGKSAGDFAFARAPEFGRQKPPLFVTHSMDIVGRMGADANAAATTADVIRHCGGLLFPSLAVGAIPAPQFLPCVLVLDPFVVLGSVKPFKKRGAPSVTRVYNTDSWTPKVREVVTDLAARLYDELTGGHASEDFMYTATQHLYVSGLPTQEDAGGFVPEGVVELDSLKSIARECWRHAARWPESALRTQRDADRMFERNMDHRDHTSYPYCEAKVAAVLSLSAVVAAFVPDHQVDGYRAFFAGVGYTGPVVVVPTTEDERRAFASAIKDDKTDMRARLQYAWKVAHMADAMIPEGARRYRL